MSEPADKQVEVAAPAPGPHDLVFRLGQRTVRLVPYSRDCWRSVDLKGVTVRKNGRKWFAAFGVGIEFLGPYVEEMALCMARGVGASLAEAEESLNAELEGIRQLIGAPEVAA